MRLVLTDRKVLTSFLLAGLLIWVWVSAAQQQEEKGLVPKPRPAGDPGLGTAYASHPGGTPEENLWQVLVLFGVGDGDEAVWDGNLQIWKGEIYDIRGYRFGLEDRMLPQGGWHVKTKLERILESADHRTGGRIKEEGILPKGLLIRGSGMRSTQVSVSTSPGSCEFSPMLLAFGISQKCLQGRIEVRRIPAATDLSGTQQRQHDFPSISSGSGGILWVTWSSYHDRQEELNFRRYQEGQWTRLIPVPRARNDLWRPQVTTDRDNRPWLIWSQQQDGNWDIYAMPWQDNEWGEPKRLSRSAVPDIEPSVARGSDGTIYVIWQEMGERYSHIRLSYLDNGTWSVPIRVTDGDFNDWEPAIAIGKSGRVWIAWDRYTASYDVYCRSYSPSEGLSPEMKVVATERFEGHVSVAVDHQDRPWIAWESGGVNWGKDLGEVLGPESPGSPLGDERTIEVVCLDKGTWKTPAEFRPEDSLGIGSVSYNRPTLFVDPDGNLWMTFKRQYSRRAYRNSTYWESYLTRLAGETWVDPIPFPNSWTRKSTRMELAVAGDRLWGFWPSENRYYGFASRPHESRVIAGSLDLPGSSTPPPTLADYTPAPVSAPEVHPHEDRDVAAVRSHRIPLQGETLRIVRGDLHRHTELSQDNGGLSDGSLPEFYRYMIDAAAMDFGASTDHQGGGTDYWNFITQKMTDMYHTPSRFIPLYAYERNIGGPFGHRNIIYTHRNYPIVPFFQRIHPNFVLPDSPDGELLTLNSVKFGSGVRNDTELLYEEVKRTGGLAISHTSGTEAMGTDWQDATDPSIEPVVEIYQGARRNYEHLEAPRGMAEGDRGLRKAGMVWNAWGKGYRLGVIASSDHFSTHISYAMVYTPSITRQAIFNSILKRRTYGATDNIILEFWLGDHFMGSDFSTSRTQPIRVKVFGTDVIAEIHVIRNGSYIYRVAPDRAEVEFEYVDNDAKRGEHWYYVRVEQKDDELAWSSPIWVEYE